MVSSPGMEAAEIWRQPLYTILSAIESVLLDENGQPFRPPAAVSSLGSAGPSPWAATAPSDGFAPDASNVKPRGGNPFGMRSISSSTTSSGHSSGTEGPLLPPPPPQSTLAFDSPRPIGMKRKATATLDPWGDGEVKAQRLTNALSSRLARSLSVSRNSPDLVDSGSSSAWSSDAMQCSPPRIAARPTPSTNYSNATPKTFEERVSKPAGQVSSMSGDPSAFVLKPIAKARSTSQTRAMAARGSSGGIHGLAPLIRDGSNHGNFEDREGSISDVETPLPSAPSPLSAAETTTNRALSSDDGTAWLAALTEPHGLPGQASGPFNVDQWLLQQAHAHNMSAADFQHHCQQRLHSVKYCLDLLSHGSLPPSTSPAPTSVSPSSGAGSGGGSGAMDYTMLRQTVLDLQRQCHWLGERGYRGLVQVFPDLGRHRDMLLSVVQYVHIREDMAQLVSTPTGMALQRIAETGTSLPDYFAQKQALYKDLLRQNGLEWRVRGYAIDDTLFQRTQQWFLDLDTAYVHDLRRVFVVCNNSSAGFSSIDRLPSNMASSPLLRLELYPPMHSSANSGNDDSAMLKRLMAVILRNVKTAARCVEFVGRTSASLAIDCFYLAAEYTRLSMSQTSKPDPSFHHDAATSSSSSMPNLSVGPVSKSKGSSAAKVMYQFERVLSLLTCLRAIRDGEALVQLSPFPGTNAATFRSISTTTPMTHAPHPHFSPTAAVTSPFIASPTVPYSPAPFSPAQTSASHPIPAAVLPALADLVPEMGEFAAALVQASLHLFAHLGHHKQAGHLAAPTGSLCIFVEFCLRWVNKIIEFGGARREFAPRLAPLYESLNALEAMV
ncbi:hypothetical protein H4R34_003241 [Dimargaris verticillata]|uniref:Uncharacterized protein n=1 Tax=Dimargaris verticillata TaxID=2761393 RepID=A0A9W8B6G4_9FUNG|nr:hypothetical protein H4R34_003241 [Dimargaris verticillata]